MKVNFNVPLKNAKGEDLKENGKVVMMQECILDRVFYGNGAKGDAPSKLEAYLLFQKLSLAKGAVDISTEEGTLIKNAAAGLPAGLYGQIYEIIEKK